MPSKNFRISLFFTRHDCRISAAEREVKSDVGAADDQLVLGLSALLNLHARKHVHRADNLLPREVPDLNGRATIDDVGIDGEVGIDEPHPVLKSVLDTIEEVTDMAADTAQHGELLGLGKIHPGLHLLAGIPHPEL
eukprot:CAMPEP_0185901588 /NCGR_PEP_ID=MMETSP0196C-20130402/932_1 /TAXON_ID=2932 /ORGANISM="Alexandrium fundyense, Strain CCMP1719" /LENGTH=135 /DNA_ID=CAMNT_0028620265 /DNA_START=140 /DNA_END=543 /DNA_ORIENTATION=+